MVTELLIKHNDGGDIRIKDTGGVLGLGGFSAYVDANSVTQTYTIAPQQVTQQMTLLQVTGKY